MRLLSADPLYEIKHSNNLRHPVRKLFPTRNLPLRHAPVRRIDDFFLFIGRNFRRSTTCVHVSFHGYTRRPSSPPVYSTSAIWPGQSDGLLNFWMRAHTFGRSDGLLVGRSHAGNTLSGCKPSTSRACKLLMYII